MKFRYIIVWEGDLGFPLGANTEEETDSFKNTYEYLIIDAQEGKLWNCEKECWDNLISTEEWKLEGERG